MARALAEAFVRVRADTSGFKRDVEKDADAAGRSGGSRFGDAFSRDADNRLGALRRLFVRDMADAGGEAGDEAGRSFGSRFTAVFRRIGTGAFAGLSGGFSAVTKGALPAAKALLAVSAAAATVTTAARAGTALAPLAGLLAALPGIAIGAATAIGTLKLAVSGMGDAFGAAMSGNAKKLKQALEQLPPAAQSVVKEVARLRPELLSIRATAQKNLFMPLQGQLTALVKTLAGPLKQGIADTAIQFGLAGKQVAQFARQSKSVELMRAAFGNVSFSLGILRQAIDPVLAGLRGFALEGVSFLPQIAASVSQVAQRFGVWLQKMVDTGRAAEWIRNAIATVRQLGGVLSNVFGILKSVFSAASAGGSNVIGVLGQALGALNRFLKTAQGQAALTSIFQALAQIGQALSPIIAALVTQLGGLAGPVGQLATQLGPILLTAINALGPALQQLQPGITALFNGLGLAFTEIANSGALPALAKAISAIAIAIEPVLPVVGQLAGILANNLAAAVRVLVAVFGPVISALTQSLAPVLPQIAAAFTRLAVAMTPIATQLGQQLGQALVQILPPLLQIIPQLLQGLVPALIQLMQALAPLMPSLLQLGVVLAQNIAQVLPPLIPPLTQLIELMAQWTAIMAPVLGWLLQIAAAISAQFGASLAAGVRVVAGALNAIFGWFKWLFDVLLGHSVIPDIVNGITRWFGSLPGRVIGLFASMASGAASQAAGLLRYVSRIHGAIASYFSGAGGWLYGAGRAIIIGLWNGVVSLWNWLAAGFRRLTNLIPNWKGPEDRDRKLLTPAGVAIMRGLVAGIDSMVPALRSTLAGVTDSISGGLSPTLAVAGAGVSRTTARLSSAAVPATVPAGGAASDATFDAAAFNAAVGELRAAAASVRGMEVHMDGQKVGAIVSRQLGRATDQRRRTG